MTKRHFVALAEAIKVHNCSRLMETYTPFAFNRAHLDTLAEFCQAQNPQFNRERWLGYIEGTNGANGGTVKPVRKVRVVSPQRKLARRLEGN